MNKPSISTGAVLKWFFVYLLIFIIILGILYILVNYKYNKNSTDADIEKIEQSNEK